MAHMGHSVIGDALYGRAAGNKKSISLQKLSDDDQALILDFPRQALHALELSFTHPRTFKKLKFTTPLPDDMALLIKTLKKIK
jgi:23S rRNA pseudouridine1911/1915/1917 synthase